MIPKTYIWKWSEVFSLFRSFVGRCDEIGCGQYFPVVFFVLLQILSEIRQICNNSRISQWKSSYLDSGLQDKIFTTSITVPKAFLLTFLSFFHRKWWIMVMNVEKLLLKKLLGMALVFCQGKYTCLTRQVIEFLLWGVKIN